MNLAYNNGGRVLNSPNVRLELRWYDEQGLMGVCEGQVYMQDIYTEYINALSMISAHTCYLRLLLGILCQLYLKHLFLYTYNSL